MNIGNIYVWDTDKAIGHELRRKWHIFICDEDWQAGHTFLLINKTDYGGDHKIFRLPDYPFLKLDFSFIGCGNFMAYTDHEMSKFSPQFEGRLSQHDINAVYNAVLSNDIMEAWKISRVCNALLAVIT